VPATGNRRFVRRVGPRALALGAGTLAAVVILPLAAVAWNAATPKPDVWAHLARTLLGDLVVSTVALLAGVGAVTALLGVTLAWCVAAYEFPGRRVFEWALVLPMAMPAYVFGFVMLGAFDYGGPVAKLWISLGGTATNLPQIRSYGGVVAAMSLVYYPYVYLLARNAFSERSAAATEAARTLGLGPWAAFRRLALPAARPAIAAGLALALMETLADFGTVSLYGYQTFTVAVYRVWFGMFDRVAAGQLATTLLAFTMLLLALERWGRRSARFTIGEGAAVAARTELPPRRRWLVTALCSVVVGVAFVVPTMVLITWTVRAAAEGLALDVMWRQALNTGAIGLAATAICVAAALLLAYAGRIGKSRGLARATNVALLGYAIPGSVVAVGVLGVLVVADRVLAATAGALGAAAPPLLATSALGLLFAYVVRFLAVAFLPVQAGLGRISTAYDESARSLGAGPGRILRAVHAPLLRGAALTATILVLVDVMKEMPATMLLRPFGFDTLAVGIWQATTESLWLQAAPPALAIVALGTLLVAVLAHGRGASGFAFASDGRQR
jgi:iron(III) transport system permease protein